MQIRQNRRTRHIAGPRRTAHRHFSRSGRQAVAWPCAHTSVPRPSYSAHKAGTVRAVSSAADHNIHRTGVCGYRAARGLRPASVRASLGSMFSRASAFHGDVSRAWSSMAAPHVCLQCIVQPGRTCPLLLGQRRRGKRFGSHSNPYEQTCTRARKSRLARGSVQQPGSRAAPNATAAAIEPTYGFGNVIGQ